jgi:hypothetical protein
MKRAAMSGLACTLLDGKEQLPEQGDGAAVQVGEVVNSTDFSATIKFVPGVASA